jgi:hypothetical protein
MPITVNTASPPKNLMNEPMVLTNLTGASTNDDPIIAFASKIEKVSTRIEIEEIIKNLGDEREFDFFKLGGAIAVAQALFDKSRSEFKDYKNFREYVGKALSIQYHKAMRAAGIYNKLLQLDIPWSAFENIGWTKVLALLDVVTKDNVKQWVTKATGLNVLSLKTLVEAEKQKGKTDTEQGPKTISSKTFKLHDDQKEIIEAALNKIKEESGTAFDGVALEYMAQSCLGGGTQFQNWDQALTYKIKHHEDRLLLLHEVITRLEQLYPDVEIEIKLKDSVVAA